jgi:hypothetical protein
MKIAGILKPVLFIYECIRLLLLLLMFILRLSDTGSFIWLAFSVNGVLFPLMALFLWLDISSYRAYLPLFIAGKCIGILSLTGWLMTFLQSTIIVGLAYLFVQIDLVFLCGDLLALAAVLLIYRDTRISEKQRLTNLRLTNQGFEDTEENNADNSNS